MSFLKKILGRDSKPITADELAKALKNNEFVFYYQPEWDLKTNRVIGLEALMRWESPVRGYVSPMDFIPILESSGVIHQFTRFLFNQTLSDLVKLLEIQPDLFMAVNLSVCQLQELGLIDIIKKALDANHLDAKHLECELTESQNLTDDLLSNGVLEKLVEMKIPVSMDDFGEGYSSYARLKRLNVSKLKIDIEFVRTLFDDPKNESVVESIIQLGHDLGFPVLAEGIETTEQQTWLRDHGCDYGQGFWFSRALPMAQLVPFLTQKNQPTEKE